MSALRIIPVVLLVAGLAASALATEPGVETTVIHVRGAASASPAAIRHLRKRIASAALEACGAAPGSLTEVKEAVAHTRCWHDSYATGVAQITAAVDPHVAMPLRPSEVSKP